jgi:hypothetical protein
MAKRQPKQTVKAKPKAPSRGRHQNTLKALEKTKFVKGERRVGRQKGTKNKLGVKIKEALLTALEMSGRDGKGKDGAVGYFVWLSRNEPVVFGGLIGKVLPMQVEVKDMSEKRYTPEEAIERLRERGLPVPPSLTSLAGQVGRAVAVRQEEDEYDEELGEADPDEDDSNEQEIDDAA